MELLEKTQLKDRISLSREADFGHFWVIDFIVSQMQRMSIRVATDLENLEKSGNLKETSESQGICVKSQGMGDRIPKVREKSGNFSKIHF